jgi:hypothetical protein
MVVAGEWQALENDSCWRMAGAGEWQVLRIGRVSVAVRRLSASIDQLRRDPARQEPAGKVQLDRDQLIARDRHSTERVFLCL